MMLVLGDPVEWMLGCSIGYLVLMVYAFGLEASTRYFDVLHFLFEHFMSIFTVSDFFLPLLHLICPKCFFRSEFNLGLPRIEDLGILIVNLWLRFP